MTLIFQVRSCCPRKGFTLIEMLVVMAIVGILVGMLFPAISMVKKSGRKSQCANNMRQLGMGVIQYANGNNSVLPGSQAAGTYSWDDLTVNYEALGTPMKFPGLKCPEDSRLITASPRSYVMVQQGPSSVNDGFIVASGVSRLLLEATVPDATILLFERWTKNDGSAVNNTQGQVADSFYYGFNQSVSGTDAVPKIYIPQLSNTAGSYYHGSSMNYLMADGRLQSLNPNIVLGYTNANDLGWKVVR